MDSNDIRARWRGLLDQARGGSPEALGQLLEPFRMYLLAVAHEELDQAVRGKVGSSDLVQESLTRACQHFPQFQGTDADDLREWLRQILRNGLIDLRRHFAADRRDLGREQPIAINAPNPQEVLPASEESPSQYVIRQEEEEALRRALGRLPEEYRQVIRRRNYEAWSFEEIGRDMNRSADAARMLHGRAIAALSRLLKECP